MKYFDIIQEIVINLYFELSINHNAMFSMLSRPHPSFFFQTWFISKQENFVGLESSDENQRAMLSFKY